MSIVVILKNIKKQNISNKIFIPQRAFIFKTKTKKNMWEYEKRYSKSKKKVKDILQAQKRTIFIIKKTKQQQQQQRREEVVYN